MDLYEFDFFFHSSGSGKIAIYMHVVYELGISIWGRGEKTIKKICALD